jgi:hypothetical protein
MHGNKHVLMIRYSGKIVNRLGLNKSKSGFGQVWVTYLKINFRLKPNGPQAGPGKILQFQPMQTSVHGEQRVVRGLILQGAQPCM